MKVKGQMQVMEYLMLAIFVVGFMFFIMIFLAGSQSGQIEDEKERLEGQRVTGLVKQLLASPFMAEESGIFSQSRLEAFVGSCEKLRSIFGKGMFMELEVFDGKVGLECTRQKLDGCNIYRFCTENAGKQKVSLEIPVSVVMGKGREPVTMPGNLLVGVGA